MLTNRAYKMSMLELKWVRQSTQQRSKGYVQYIPSLPLIQILEANEDERQNLGALEQVMLCYRGSEKIKSRPVVSSFTGGKIKIHGTSHCFAQLGMSQYLFLGSI